MLGAARLLARDPTPLATAELLATGERHSAALLGIALDRAPLSLLILGLGTVGRGVPGRRLA